MSNDLKIFKERKHKYQQLATFIGVFDNYKKLHLQQISTGITGLWSCIWKVNNQY